MGKKVVNIVAKGKGWDNSPHEGEVWGVNDVILRHDHLTRCFHMHDMDWIKMREEPSLKLIIEKANKSNIPIMTLKKYDFIPTSVEYPLDEIVTKFRNCYFGSSIDYMAAYALYLDFDVINYYGVNMVISNEYCISPDSKILTNDLNWENASDVNVGDEIVAFDEHTSSEFNRRYRKAIIKNKSIVHLPRYLIELSDGTELVASAEHRWLVEAEHMKQWRRTDELLYEGCRRTIGGRKYTGKPSKLVKIFKPWEKIDSRDAGYLAGVLDGEGWYCNGRILGFAQRGNECLEEARRCAGSFGFRFSLVPSKDGCFTNILLGGGQEVVELLGKIRPPRLLSKFDGNEIGALYGSKYENPYVTNIKPIGEGELIGFETSTGTIIVNGIASHNSSQKPSQEFWMGMAMGMGKEVNVDAGQYSNVMKTFNQKIYGYFIPQFKVGGN